MSARKRTTALIAAGVLLAAAAAAYFLFLSGSPSFARLRQGRDFNVIVITLDTTRADHLPSYGCRDLATPTLDAFAARGVRFEKCFAQTPLTLPSHTTLFTGTLPLFHGIRDNGGFFVPEKLKTMAELFKDKGYETGAFIAAYVLDSKWGLNQGFDTYFDKFDLGKFKRISLGTVQRPANEILDAALPWLESRKDKRFFAWLHLYDPHSPYEPPPPYDKLYAAHPYLGEIAFADSQIQRLWQFLDSNGLLEKTFIVFAGDHGESLGEHEEQSHGFFIYQASIHVPLIIVTPFPEVQGVVSPEVATLSDVLPTVCDMAGLTVPSEVQGKSLLPAFFGRRRKDTPLAYSETYYPRFHFGWSDLKCVQDDRYKLILAPVPELYDVVADPREEKNLVYLEKKAYERLNAGAEALIAGASRNAYETDYSKVDEETREKLSALGYIGSFTDPAKLAGKKLANPKEKIGVFNQLSQAREMGMNGKAEEAIRIIKGIIASDPDIVDAYFSVGNVLFQERRYEEAIGYFTQVLGRKPDDSFAAINIALSYEGMEKYDEAERFLLGYIAKGFVDAQFYFMLGNMNFIQKKYDQAIPYFEKCLSSNADSAGSYNMLAAVYIVKDDLERAEQNLSQALRINPRLSTVHYNWAQVAEKRGRLAEAEAEYLKELEISPRHFRSMYNLSRVYRLTGDAVKEQEFLNKCLEADPRFPLAYFYLARICLVRGERYQEAIDLAKKGIELKPEKADLPMGYFLLADLYNRLGMYDLSEENARKGQAAAVAAAATTTTAGKKH
jgi:arylsulfatase A-like enzyme/Tfp pilus assembly protein PilF